MKHNVITQFIKNVNWGDLDYLIVDCPPGTGDEPLSVAQTLPDADGAIMVTTPQQVAVTDVKKCISFCSQLQLKVIGIVENMSGFVCPHCNERTDIFKGNGGSEMAEQFNVPFLGAIPIDPEMGRCCDIGEPFITSDSDSPTVQAIKYVFTPLLEL